MAIYIKTEYCHTKWIMNDRGQMIQHAVDQMCEWFRIGGHV